MHTYFMSCKDMGVPKKKKFRGDVSALVMTVSVWCTEGHVSE
jgi:hypothetical protein